MDNYNIDDLGKKILDILHKDSKISSDDIALQLRVDVEQVDSYIKKFQEDRIILGYQTRINWQRVRPTLVKGIIEVRVIPERSVGFDLVAEYIYNFPEVESVYLLSGGYDLLVHVNGESLNDVAHFVSEKLATIKGVKSTVSHFMLKKYKEGGIILTEIAESDRLPFAP